MTEENQNFDDIVLDIKQEDEKIQEEANLNLFDIYSKINNWLLKKTSVSLQEKLLFFELLSAVINAGVPLNVAFKMVGAQVKNPKLKLVINSIRDKVNDGVSFAKAMEAYPEVFDVSTRSIIAAGEKSGKLVEVMKELVVQYERMYKIQKKVKSVMTYPVIVLIVMVLLVIAVMLFVVPKLQDLFGEGNLPFATRVLIGGSNFFVQKWWAALGGVLVFIMGFSYFKSTDFGNKILTKILLKTPIIGEFIKKVVLSKFTRIFGFLVSSGVPIVEGLKITAYATGNVVYEEKLLLAADDLVQGIELSENFADNEKLFPSMLVGMLNIGEQTSSLDKIMVKIADFYDEELERKIATISKLMEPFILVMMAGFALFLILAIYMPILQMNDQVIG